MLNKPHENNSRKIALDSFDIRNILSECLRRYQNEPSSVINMLDMLYNSVPPIPNYKEKRSLSQINTFCFKGMREDQLNRYSINPRFRMVHVSEITNVSIDHWVKLFASDVRLAKHYLCCVMDILGNKDAYFAPPFVDRRGNNYEVNGYGFDIVVAYQIAGIDKIPVFINNL